MRVYRSWLMLMLLFMVACGPEAAPRASTPAKTSTTKTAAPQASPLITAGTAAAPSRIPSSPAETAPSRTLGNPAAPIVMVEYSDYQ